jgi:hypothetical protein
MAAGRARQQPVQRLADCVVAAEGGSPTGPAGGGSEERDIGLHGQVDQGFGVGLRRDGEAAARISGLSPPGEGEQAQPT